MIYKYLFLIVAILCSIITIGIFWIGGPTVMKVGFATASVWSWIHHYIYGRKGI
jgi:hypothetical protein